MFSISAIIWTLLRLNIGDIVIIGYVNMISAILAQISVILKDENSDIDKDNNIVDMHVAIFYRQIHVKITAISV